MTPRPVLRAALLLALALATTLAAALWTPRYRMAESRAPGTLAQAVPLQIGPWSWDQSQTVVPPAPDVKAALDRAYTDLLGRAYVDQQGRRIMLSVAYVASAAQGTQVHRPEVCYPAQGFGVQALRPASIDLAGQQLPVLRARMQRQARREPVTYWIVVGHSAVASPWETRLAQLHYTLRGSVPDAVLVRVSSLDGDPERAFAEQAHFVRDLLRALDPAARLRLFGAAIADRSHP